MNEIILCPNPILRSTSSEVKLPLSEEDKVLLTEMYKYVKDNEGKAVGLSAIQVGVPKRMCAIRYNGINYKLVNPKILNHSADKEFYAEGCLSVPEDHDEPVGRYKSIKVYAFDAITNKYVLINAVGYLARILQHEIDHMDGKLYTDYIKDKK